MPGSQEYLASFDIFRASQKTFVDGRRYARGAHGICSDLINAQKEVARDGGEVTWSTVLE